MTALAGIVPGHLIPRLALKLAIAQHMRESTSPADAVELITDYIEKVQQEAYDRGRRSIQFAFRRLLGGAK